MRQVEDLSGLLRLRHCAHSVAWIAAQPPQNELDLQAVLWNLCRRVLIVIVSKEVIQGKSLIVRSLWSKKNRVRAPAEAPTVHAFSATVTLSNMRLLLVYD